MSDPYCSGRCRVGGMQIVCWTCKKPATLVGDWRHCGTCERPPPKRKKPEDESSNLDTTLNRQRTNLAFANNVWCYDLVPKKESERTGPYYTVQTERSTGSLLYRGSIGWRK